jgi:hypothetical protein
VRPGTIRHDRGSAAVPGERSRSRRFGLAVIGGGISVAALIVGGSIASAHHFTAKTTPLPDHGTVGVTALGDSAPVYADNTRDVTFMLWAPDTCGKQGATPVFTDTEEITTTSLKNSTVTTSGSYTPTQTGTYEWTAKIVVDSSGSVESGPTPCTDEPVSITKATPHMSTTPSIGGVVGASASDTATVSAGFNPTGTVTFTLFAPSDPTCANPAGAVYESPAETLSGGTAHSGTFNTNAVGTYHWVAAYSGDANNAALTSPCGEETVTITTPTGGVQGTTTQTGGVQGTTTQTGGVQGISDVPTPTTGGDANIKLAVALLFGGAGLLTALTGTAVSRRVRRRGP